VVLYSYKAGTERIEMNTLEIIQVVVLGGGIIFLIGYVVAIVRQHIKGKKY
jgi:hypothetical protein